jgi:Mg-chelatase subunit ChlD
MAVLIGICLPILIMMAAFAVNLAYMELVRSELRTATDAAARAGSRTLNRTGDWPLAVAAAKNAASHNLVAGEPLQLDDADIELGTSSQASSAARFVFTLAGDQPNSVRVTGRLAPDSLTGAVRMPFANVFSRSHFNATKVAVATHMDRDIALVLDRSGSMAYAIDETYTGYAPYNAPVGWDWGDPAPPHSRWLDLIAAANEFVQRLEETPMDEYLAAVTFNHTAIIDEDLTLDYALVHTALDAYTQSFAGGSTAIGTGMNTGITALVDRGYDRPWASKTLVVMTDGIQNSGIAPSQAIARAQSHGITVHTVTFSDEADQSLMQQIANQCDGQHWHAPTSDDLIEAFREIVDNCPTLLTQ